MNYTYLHYQIALTLLFGIGPNKARKLLDLVDDCSDIFTLNLAELRRKTGFASTLLNLMKREEALHTSLSIATFLDQHKIRTIFYSDVDYPMRLNQCSDAPLLLYQKGEPSLDFERWVAVVGTRDATPYGKAICEELVRSFAGKNIVVVSGLALGIDAYVHRYCLEYKVPTIAVLGHGLDRIYPFHHRELAKRILHQGSLLTEFPPNTLPNRENFPKRNRIVAGLCDATIVIESNAKGGSLITADIANGYSRDVFAYPGNVFHPTSSGCNALIRSNQAHLVESGAHFLELMDWKTEKPTVLSPMIHAKLSPVQTEITQAIGASNIHIDELAAKTRLNLSTLNIELFDLLLCGVLNELPGKRFTLA